MMTPSAASIIQDFELLRCHTLIDDAYNNSHDQPNVSATTITAWELPFIDLHSPLALKRPVVACCNRGFFYLQNHGLSWQVLDKLRSHTHSLFELPWRKKRRLPIAYISWVTYCQLINPIQCKSPHISQL